MIWDAMTLMRGHYYDFSAKHILYANIENNYLAFYRIA